MPIGPLPNWAWAVEYNDDSVLEEYENGDWEVEPKGFKANVDIDRVVAILLIPRLSHLQKHFIRIHENERPIFFRRIRINVNLETHKENWRDEITCIGWQTTIDTYMEKYTNEPTPVNVSHYSFFYPDGSSLQTTKESEAY
jgi:hypothetical protein